MYRDILIPTDGSAGARAAVRHGIELAAQHDATVHALYVVDTHLTRSRHLLETLRQEGREAVREVEVAGAQSGVTVTTEVTEGVPHGEIVDYASRHGIDLVVLSTHGRTGLDRAVMGSVAERVVRHSPAPVLVVRGHEGDDPE